MRSARQRASEVAKPDQFDQRQMIVDFGFLMGREDDEDESLPAPLGTRGNGRRAKGVDLNGGRCELSLFLEMGGALAGKGLEICNLCRGCEGSVGNEVVKLAARLKDKAISRDDNTWKGCPFAVGLGV